MVSANMLLGLLSSDTSRNGADDLVSPGLVLVDVVRGFAPPLSSRVELHCVRGRPIYLPLVGYAAARAGIHDPAVVRLARERANSHSAIGVWWALALAASGEGSDVFGELTDRQLATGEFFGVNPAAAPDLHWYDELCVLHAVASFAAMTADADSIAAVKRAALFHTYETQPDHATTQPWAVHAFAAHEQTHPVAELLLHSAMAQHAGRLDAVGKILIADAVLAMRSPTAGELN